MFWVCEGWHDFLENWESWASGSAGATLAYARPGLLRLVLATPVIDNRGR